jgi:hypothetical protein
MIPMSRIRPFHPLTALLLAVLVSVALQSNTYAQQTVPADSQPGESHWRKMLLADRDPLPPGFPQVNPYNILASFNSWKQPILDHSGKPHAHGHMIQVIVDGGNSLQDPPNSDGTPGGDDSMAYGNFNLIRLMGIDEPPDPKGRSGMFMSAKYFIPFLSDRAYYLRLWEGDNIAAAPYYQDTIEYDAEVDRGGSMLRPPPGPPIDVNWTFGPSKLRPKSAPKK